MVEISCELTVEHANEDETYIKMSRNTLARVVRVEEVAGRAGKPFWAAARTFRGNPHLVMI